MNKGTTNNTLQTRYESLLKVRGMALSALAETGIDGLSVLVPKQRSYTFFKPNPGENHNGLAIPAALANTPCTCLGINGVVALFCALSFNGKIKMSHVSRSVLLDFYIEENSDFGTVYAYLCKPTSYVNTTTIEPTSQTREERDGKMR